MHTVTIRYVNQFDFSNINFSWNFSFLAEICNTFLTWLWLSRNRFTNTLIESLRINRYIFNLQLFNEMTMCGYVLFFTYTLIYIFKSTITTLIAHNSITLFQMIDFGKIFVCCFYDDILSWISGLRCKTQLRQRKKVSFIDW